MTSLSTTRKGEYRISPTAQVRHCTKCNAPIVWTTTVNQRQIPLSLATVRVDEQGQRFALSHFADCPDADKFRNQKPGKATEQVSQVALPDSPSQPDQAVDLLDYDDRMTQLGLEATGSSMDTAGKVTVEARRKP